MAMNLDAETPRSLLRRQPPAARAHIQARGRLVFLIGFIGSALTVLPPSLAPANPIDSRAGGASHGIEGMPGSPYTDVMLGCPGCGPRFPPRDFLRSGSNSLSPPVDRTPWDADVHADRPNLAFYRF